MKKIFFTALVAVVAIGGAFASQNTNAVLDVGPLDLTDDNNCKEDKPCSPRVGVPCILEGVQYYMHDPAEGSCVIFISRDEW
ncbi:hypothetical protein SAMN04487898_115160 [Pedobacter sp. ok626]|nr:hypothetical protein SAMN04487898_115160 [Pedobacter sp. ok626]